MPEPAITSRRIVLSESVIWGWVPPPLMTMVSDAVGRPRGLQLPAVFQSAPPSPVQVRSIPPDRKATCATSAIAAPFSVPVTVAVPSVPSWVRSAV